MGHPRLSQGLARHLRSKRLASFDIVAKRRKGSVNLSGTVKSLDVFGTCVAGEGEGIQVPSPTTLKVKAILLEHVFLKTSEPYHVVQKPQVKHLR